MGIVAALLVGAVVGAVLMQLRAGRRSQVTTPDATAPAVTASTSTVSGSVVTPETNPADPLLGLVLERLDRAVVVLSGEGEILFRNRAASILSGTHVCVLLDSAVDEVAVAARGAGPVERRVDLHGPPRVSVLLVADRVVSDTVVVVIDDVSERERIDSMRTDFVANISHELKTPVGAISVLADALLGEDDPAVVDRVAGRIAEESERAVATIDDLLELARIETAQPVDEIVALNDVVESAIARGRPVDDANGVDVTAFDTTDTVHVRCDPRQLQSAVGNLVENAVKYSEPDGVVQVRTRVDARWIEIMVADQGVGIPARDIGRIFERFYRVDRARSRATGGSGLGLSIVRHVATNHGGDVQVSSVEGEGSTFVLRLPTTLIVDPVGDRPPESATDVAVDAALADDMVADDAADAPMPDRESTQ
ncbi:MAG: ATP-binding protein [Actinomycetota bacterium]